MHRPDRGVKIFHLKQLRRLPGAHDNDYAGATGIVSTTTFSMSRLPITLLASRTSIPMSLSSSPILSAISSSSRTVLHS